MKKANEMRVIAEAKVEEILQKRKERAINLVENTISNLVSAEAALGHFNAHYHVTEEEVDVSYIADILRTFDYDVDRNGRHLTIRW